MILSQAVDCPNKATTADWSHGGPLVHHSTTFSLVDAARDEWCFQIVYVGYSPSKLQPVHKSPNNEELWSSHENIVSYTSPSKVSS